MDSAEYILYTYLVGKLYSIICCKDLSDERPEPDLQES